MFPPSLLSHRKDHPVALLPQTIMFQPPGQSAARPEGALTGQGQDTGSFIHKMDFTSMLNQQP
ncbi:hypothetical protein BS17DRAFT_788984 [Gyrodon lividus]|nr:hypothetical protein BS17DRAFT_788984 [Gyrodon lividus]